MFVCITMLMLLNWGKTAKPLLAQQPQPASQPVWQPSIQELTGLVFYSLILLLLFIVGSYVLVRAMRRFRDSITRSPRQATDTTDIWAMHKVPELDTEMEEGPGGEEDENERGEH